MTFAHVTQINDLLDAAAGRGCPVVRLALRSLVLQRNMARMETLRSAREQRFAGSFKFARSEFERGLRKCMGDPQKLAIDVRLRAVSSVVTTGKNYGGVTCFPSRRIAQSSPGS